MAMDPEKGTSGALIAGDDLVVDGLPFDFPFWIISDTHFGHDNIVKYCGRPERHEELMRNAWHEKVRPLDTIVHLGDLTLATPRYLGNHRLKSLPGRKYLLKGNHDRCSRKAYAEQGFTFMKKSFALPYKGWTIVFTHRPDVEGLLIGAPKRINVHGHIHEKLIDDPRFINVSVEQTDYSPVQITDLLDTRIALLESLPTPR